MAPLPTPSSGQRVARLQQSKGRRLQGPPPSPRPRPQAGHLLRMHGDGRPRRGEDPSVPGGGGAARDPASGGGCPPAASGRVAGGEEQSGGR